MHPVRCLLAALLLAALLLGAGAAHAANWFELDALSAATRLGIEADTDSIHHSGAQRAVTVRVSYPEPRVHRSGVPYRSVVATVEFNCEGGLAGYRDASFYAEARGSGTIAAREDGRLAPIPESTRELLPARSVEFLIRAACSEPTPAVP